LRASIRKLIPFLAAIVLAFVIVTVTELLGLAPGLFYALAGFVGGILVVAGTLFAFGFLPFEDGHDVQPHETAVSADDWSSWESASDLKLLLGTWHEGLKEDAVLGTVGPLVYSASRTIRIRAPRFESFPVVEVGHVGQLRLIEQASETDPTAQRPVAAER
jgi:hypothetical protein